MGYRTKLINKNAAQHLQSGEEIEQVAIVRATDAGSNYALAATVAHVYVFKLGGLGFGKVNEMLTRVPIGKTVIARPGRLVTIGRRGRDKPDHAFIAMSGAKKLEAYVTARGGNSG